MVDILGCLSTCLYVITGNEADIHSLEQRHIYRIDHKKAGNIFTRIINFIYTQLKISYQLAKLTRKVDLWVFFIGGEGLLLPMVTAKLWRNRVLLALAGFPENSSRGEKDPLYKIIGLLARINLSLSDRIVVYSERIITERNLGKYQAKISIAYEHHFDINVFKVQNSLNKRRKVVGYIGGLSQTKGVPNFIDAIPKVLEQESSTQFLIGGEGNIQDKIKERLGKNDLNTKVKFTGWIPHYDIPKYLNELKLLVLPSYSEGLPNIVLEAMACGTPVLTTAVAAILDVIIDNETGFIMEDNSPQCIAQNVIRALNHPKLEKITESARALVGKRFAFETVVQGYKNVLTTLK
ncbi:glycosyltransferase family 4 protein [Chloroflexota bacterium]